MDLTLIVLLSVIWLVVGMLIISIFELDEPENIKQKIIYFILTGPIKVLHSVINYIFTTFKKIYNS